MLAGLLFAVRDAEDAPGALAATLPFAGVTLIEYQARLLAQAGAAQIVIVVTRLTPELLGAIARIQRRGVVVDAVRTAAEAAAKLHPLARVLMLADGLVTTATTIAPLTQEGGDALLTIDERAAPASFERVGGQAAWAGVARLSPQRVAEVAALPRDYDVQSTLIRVAAQAQARHVALDTADAGHGIERSGAALADRGRAILAATVSARRGWFDRWVVAPIARRVLPALMTRGIGTMAVAAGSGAVALIGLALVAFDHAVSGLLLTLVATIGMAVVATLAWMRDEAPVERAVAIATWAVPGLAVLLLGRDADSVNGDMVGTVIAVALIAAAALGERAAREATRRRWWGSPPAYLAVVTLLTLGGFPVAALAIAALYATATAAAAIEALRVEA